jgi:hypothetical protein
LEVKELVNTLVSLAEKGLLESFDSERGLFHFKVRKNGDELLKVGHSLRYTIICLLGLSKLKAAGGNSPIEIRKTCKEIISKGEVRNVGDLALLVWLCSIAWPDYVEKMCSELNVMDSISAFLKGGKILTTELAWCLTCLSFLSLSTKNGNPRVTDLMGNAFRKLKANYGGKGIFMHVNSGHLSGNIRGRIGCFADQVYPIYGLSKFYEATGELEALKIAGECGDAVCSLQGDLGQWWWHYDSVTGKVVGRYPVFSVHQDGMAPMALFELGRVSGNDYGSWIYKGLTWITGCNELNYSLIDAESCLIWRNIHRPSFGKYTELLSSVFFNRRQRGYPDDLRILYECWPYHLGWLLYAFAHMG